MAVNGPIILVEDNKNDTEVILQAISDLGIANKVTHFPSTNDAFEYLLHTTEQPFLILSEIRMPSGDGLLFRKKIHEHPRLRKKSIPFIFFTGILSQEIVNSAYDLDVQGFFEKETSYDHLKEQLLCIFLYWHKCLHPNKDV